MKLYRTNEGIIMEVNEKFYISKFSGNIAINRIKRKLADLTHYLFREMSFADGAF